MKQCPRCGKEITEPRKKYCDDTCKYWYNQIKRSNERHLPPVKKRNRDFFYMVVGSTRAKSGLRQGKRCGGMITGAMSAMVDVTVEELVEVTPANVRKHFEGIPNYKPTYIRLGDQSKIMKSEVRKELNIVTDKINLIQKEPFVNKYLNNVTPFYFTKNDGEEKLIGFMLNKPHDPDFAVRSKRKFMADKIWNLRQHDYKYIIINGEHDCPLEQIKFICRNGYKFDDNKVLIQETDKGYSNFIGNIPEHNIYFFYRIYDFDLLSELIELLNLAEINY